MSRLEIAEEKIKRLQAENDRLKERIAELLAGKREHWMVTVYEDRLDELYGPAAGAIMRTLLD